MINFVDLHLHSTYSNLDGFGLPGQIVARAKEIGRTSIALTDHGSVSGLVKFWKACKEQGLKPIYGSEQYIVDSLPKMFETKQMRKNHITILAKNATGYKNLLKIASAAYSDGFYYRPTCFPSGTKILSERTVRVRNQFGTDDFCRKILPTSIEKLVVGDLVLSYNQTTGEKELKKITKTYNDIFSDTFLKLKFDNENELILTPDHPIGIIEDGKLTWKNANAVSIGDIAVQYLYNGLSLRLHKFAMRGKTLVETYGEEIGKKIETQRLQKVKELWEGEDNYRSNENKKKRLDGLVDAWADGKSGYHTKQYHVLRSNIFKKYGIGVKGIRAYLLKIGQNKMEEDFEVFLDELCPGEFAYNGDSRLGLDIDGIYPDFVNITGKKKVIEVFSKSSKNYYNGSYENYENNRRKRLNSIGYEVLFVNDEDFYHRIDKVGNEIISFIYNPNTELSRIISIEEIARRKKEPVYNLEVEGNNNYFAYGVLVHNCDKGILFNNHEGLVILSGCWTGFVQEHLKNNDLDGAIKIVSEFRDVFGEDYFLETQHFPLFKDTIDLLNIISEKFKIPMVLTCDPHYLKEDQAYIQEILHAIRDRREFDERQIMYGAFQWPADMLFEAVSALSKNIKWQELFENTCSVAESCNNVEMQMGGVPRYPVKQGELPYNLLLDLCREGIIKRSLDNLQGQEKINYNAQIQKELKLVREKDFIDYFLVVADIVNWAKTNGILVGPARGSSAGSLLCYLVGITEIDPLKHSLLFERFLDESRYDLPDIDIDFDDSRRDDVKKYISDRYGNDNVCSVATFAQFKGRNSLDEIGKVYKIPPGEISNVKRFLIERSGADMRVDLTIEDTFSMSPQAAAVRQAYPKIEHAIVLEGQLRHMAMHAAGVIVSDKPLSDVMALYERDGIKVSSLEMKDAGDIGLVKIDILGITELSIISKICEQIGWSANDVYGISLEDEETLNGFREIDVEGIFQFEGDSTKSVLRQLPKLDFEQLTACVTLSKPGPAHCVGHETEIYDCNRKEIISIGAAYKRGLMYTLSLYPDGSIRPQKIKKLHKIGSWSKNKQQTFKVFFKNGRMLRATAEHCFLTQNGFRKLSELHIGDKIVSTNKKIWSLGTFGAVKPNSGNFKKGRIPWNKGKKWPEASALRKKQWSDGIYKNTGFAVWNKEHPDILKANALAGSRKRSQQIAKLSPEERRVELANFIAAGTKTGFGKWGNASDGHRCESSFELSFEEFLINNAIMHTPHPYLGNKRRADQKIMGVFIELDGMNRSKEYWNEKYKNGEPFIVITKNNHFKEQIAFAFEKVTNHDWYSIGVTEVIKIEDAEDSVVYDLEMETVPNYLANGIVVHNSGGTTFFIAKARGEQVKGFDWNPILERITHGTNYQIIYQEQVLQIVREIGKMSWTDANKIRNFMSKSEGEQAFEAYWPMFRDGALQNGINEEQAHKIWDSIKTMGRWAFNKSHAVSYAILAFWSMYFKRHFPLQFYWARLVREKDKEKQYRLLLEINKRKIKILPPEIGKSSNNWTIENGTALRAGLTDLKGIGEKTALKILESNVKSLEELKAVKIKGISKRHIESLENVASSADFFGLRKFDALDKISKKRQKLVDIRDHDKQYDIEVAGIFVEMNYKDIHEERRSRGQSSENIKDPKIAKYAMLLLEDETDHCLVNVGRYLFANIGERIWDAYNNGYFVVVKGIKVSNWRIVRAKSVDLYNKEGGRIV